ncbi:MAG TPA: phosphatidate cytidylyltransferase [Thermomicrobiales bacterium]|nr:phosphatidate cytidylyltransferase [Thermomicrobiales bacterium]
MLRQRALSSVVIVAVTLAAAVLGRAVFAAFVVVALGVALHELYGIFRHAGHRPLAAVGFGAVLVLPVVALLGRWDAWAPGLIALAVLLPLGALLLRADHRGALTDWALTVTGALYVALPAAYFVLLRELPGAAAPWLGRLDAAGLWQSAGHAATARGLGWFLLAQVVTWLTDVGAYFVGRRWGRRKLAPAISPGKSVAGAVGGVAAAAPTAWLCAWLFGLSLGPAALGVGALLSVAGQAGDLAESLLKRQAGVKDSGALIPGHGGILDRLDSLLVVAVATYFLALLAA